jgi:hypothetical protein
MTERGGNQDGGEDNPRHEFWLRVVFGIAFVLCAAGAARYLIKMF